MGVLLVRANINRYFTVKGNVYYGTISGNDEDASNPKNRQRNLDFKSQLLDISVNAEINILGFESNRRYFSSQAV